MSNPIPKIKLKPSSSLLPSTSTTTTTTSSNRNNNSNSNSNLNNKLLELPLNILDLILNFSLPKITKTSNTILYKFRYKILLNLSSISKKFNLLSQKQLYLHINLTSPGSALLLINQSNFKQTFNSKTLRINGDTWLPKHSILILKILLTCTNLELIKIKNLQNLDPCILAWAPGLKELHLEFVGLKNPKPSTRDYEFLMWHFPLLTKLFIDSITYQDYTLEYLTTSFLLNPISLPKLETLSYQWSPETSPPYLDLVGPKLKNLLIYRYTNDATPPPASNPSIRISYPSLPDLKELSSLEHLSIDIRRGNELNSIYELNCSPTSLRITSDESLHFSNQVELYPFFQSPLPPPNNSEGRIFKNLSLIIMRALHSNTSPLMMEGRLKTRAFCQEWGIDLKEVIFCDFDDGKEIAQWLTMIG